MFLYMQQGHQSCVQPPQPNIEEQVYILFSSDRDFELCSIFKNAVVISYYIASNGSMTANDEMENM
jgi:hypothetical protein